MRHPTQLRTRFLAQDASWIEMKFMGRKLEGACEGGPSGVRLHSRNEGWQGEMALGAALVLGCSNPRLPKTGQKSA